MYISFDLTTQFWYKFKYELILVHGRYFTEKIWNPSTNRLFQNMNFKNIFLRNNNRLGLKIFMAKCPIILPIKWAHFWHSKKKFNFTGFFHQNNFSSLGGQEWAHFKCIFMGNFAVKILRPNLLLFLKNKFLKFKFLKSLFVDRFQIFFVISLPWTKISVY